MKSRTSVVITLGASQTLAWASSFYLAAMLAAPMARDLGLQPSHIYAAVSMSLVIAALVGPWAGRRIDLLGGRRVLLASGALFTLALLMMAAAQGPLTLALAWAVLGLAMGMGLYDTAFAALVRLFGAEARKTITGITLIAGFASTVGWPLSAWMESMWGWRGACLGWAALHVLLGLPLNLRLPRLADAAALGAGSGAPLAAPSAAPAVTATDANGDQEVPMGRMALVAGLFVLMGFVSTSIATHLPTLLQAAGAPLTTAVAVAALAGPSQVLARVLELGLLSRHSPLLAARLAALGHPLGAAGLLLIGPLAALPFVVLHGMGNGLLTIVRGTLPLALFGSHGYGARQGWIALPGRLMGALSPWLMGLAIASWGVGALWLTLATGMAALLALLLMHSPGGRE